MLQGTHLRAYICDDTGAAPRKHLLLAIQVIYIVINYHNCIHNTNKLIVVHKHFHSRTTIWETPRYQPVLLTTFSIFEEYRNEDTEKSSPELDGVKV
jgi:hypothetical protein